MKFIADCIKKNDLVILRPSQNIELQEGKYEVEIKTDKTLKRSDRQNAMMWSIINRICKHINGDIADSYELYCQILEMADAPSDTYKLKDISLESAKALLKHVKVISQEIDSNGEIWDTIWAFKGISQMNTKEASQLIETTKKYASEVGLIIDEGYWNLLEELSNGQE